MLANNEGFIGHRDNQWSHHGDSVDVALLIMAHKLGIVKEKSLNSFPEQAVIPFEPELRFAASLNQVEGRPQVFVKGALSFFLFQWLLAQGYNLDEARNGTLLLMVLFENIHVFNSRSETRSALQHSPLRNRILLFGTLVAQLIHIGAMYTPWISEVLHIQPVSPQHWLQLLGLALSVLVVMELHKFLRQKIF